MTDTEKKIAEIREALEKATPGPWVYDDICDDIYADKTDVIVCNAVGPEDGPLIANDPEWLRFLLNELDRKDEENRKLREERDAVAEGYRQQVELAGKLMDKLVFVQKRGQKLIKKLREITKLLGGVTFTDGRQWGAYNALCDIVEDIEKELSK